MSLYDQYEEEKKKRGVAPGEKLGTSLYDQYTADVAKHSGLSSSQVAAEEVKKPSLFENIKTGVSNIVSSLSGKKKIDEVNAQVQAQPPVTSPTVTGLGVQKNLFDFAIAEQNKSAQLSKSILGSNEPSGKYSVAGSIASDLKAGYPQTKQQVESIVSPVEWKNIPQDLWNSIKEPAVKAISDYKASFELPKDTPKSKLVAQSLTNVVSTANVLFTPFNALLTVANDVPVVAQTLRALIVPFVLLGESASKTSNLVIDQLPISDQAKSNLKPAVGEVAALISQIALGHVINVGTAKARGTIKNVGVDAFEKLTKDVIDQSGSPKTLQLTADQVREINRGLGTKANLDLISSLGMDSKGWKDAALNGINVTIPSEKIIRIVDKPYWEKVKKIFNQQPTDKTKVTSMAGVNKTTFGGYLTEEAGKMPMTPENLKISIEASDLRGTEVGKQINEIATKAEAAGKDVSIDLTGQTGTKLVTPGGNTIGVSIIAPKVTPNVTVTSPNAPGQKQTTVADTGLAKEVTTNQLTAPADLLINHEVGDQDPVTVADYVAKIKAGEKIEPILVIREGEKYGIEDGKHRYLAYKQLGIKDIPIKIVDAAPNLTQATEVKRVADNILKNNSDVSKLDAEAMARDVIKNREFNKPQVNTQEVVKPSAIETLPADVPVYEEAKRTGAKRISPERVAHQQTTPEAGIEKLVEKTKKKVESNSQSWVKAADKVQALIDKYGDTMPMRSTANIQKYPNLSQDIYEYAQLKKYAVRPSNMADTKKQFMTRAEQTKWTPKKEEDYRTRVKKEYIDLVNADISKGYKYPEAVLNYDKSFKTAVDNRARYEKGLRTSFSVDDSRIVFDNVDQIGAGMKRQDGKPITDYQKREITNGVIDFANALKLDMKGLAKDDRWVYVHLSGTNPFLMNGIAGLYRPGKDNISISVGGREFFYKIVDGKKVKEYITPTVSHELGHAIDFKSNHKLIEPSLVNKLKYNYNQGEFTYLEQKYYRDSDEVVARMIEEYVGVAQGSEIHFDHEAYWNKQIFESEIKPAIEAGLDKQFANYRTDKVIERVKPPAPPALVEPVKAVPVPESKAPVQEPNNEPKPVPAEKVVPPVKAPKTAEEKKFLSRVYDRLKAEHPEILDQELEYLPKHFKDEANKAVALLEKDKNRLYKIAMGMETSRSINPVTANIVLAEKALGEGNNSLYASLVTHRSLAQTERGSLIAMEKASVTDNSTSRYVKELITTRLNRLGKGYLSNITSSITKMTNTKKAKEIINKEVEKIKEKVKPKRMGLAEAQAFLDSLVCK